MVADSLSQCVPAEVPSAATQLCIDRNKEDMYNAQCSDPAIKTIAEALQHSLAKPKGIEKASTPTDLLSADVESAYLSRWSCLPQVFTSPSSVINRST